LSLTRIYERDYDKIKKCVVGDHFGLLLTFKLIPSFLILDSSFLFNLSFYMCDFQKIGVCEMIKSVVLMWKKKEKDFD
jgi:hypothetical protein